ncbi:MAG: CYTH domain-containing protein [Gemmatimonadales bacterium]|jgi:inorganic triphosphatase YgiF
MSPSHLEIEAKLVILSESPREIALAIGQLDALGEWLLRKRRPVAVRDTYFDVADDALGKLGIALRLRRSADECLITVKGPEREADGVLERRELEDSWTEVALDSVLAYLTSFGLELTVPDGVSSDDDPERVLGAIGLVPTQDRGTTRVRGEVIARAEDTGSLAELSVDEVTYLIGSRNVRHYEVEIELEHAGDVATLGAVRAELQRRWNDLRSWSYSKYATGRALAKLLTHLDSEGLIGPGGVLKPAAYSAVEELLQQQG